MPASSPAEALAKVRQVTVDGVEVVGRELQSLTTLARAHAESTAGHVKELQSSWDDALTEALNALTSQVREVRGNLLERAERQASGVARAEAWTGDIMRLGQSINEIAASARILTFNARVESARIGEQGKGFAVIAQAIQDLAQQIRAANQSVTAIVKQLATALPELHQEADGIARTVGEDTERIEHRLGAIITAADGNKAGLLTTCTTDSDVARDLSDRAERVLQALDFQSRAEALLAQAAAQCTELSALAGLASPPGPDPQRS